MSFLEIMYGNNNNIAKIKNNQDVILVKFQKFMRERILSLRKLNLDSVSAQAALKESRNFFFRNKKDINNPSSIVEASLYKDFDLNMLELGLDSMLSEYLKLSIKDSLGLSFKEFMDLPIHYRKTLKKVLEDKIEEAEREKKNARNNNKQ